MQQNGNLTAVNRVHSGVICIRHLHHFSQSHRRWFDSGSRLLAAGVESVGPPLEGPASPAGEATLDTRYDSFDVRIFKLHSLASSISIVTNFTMWASISQVRAEHSTLLLVLAQVLNGGTDVFRCIAAEWKGVDPESVNDTLRQQAKQVQPGKNTAV